MSERPFRIDTNGRETTAVVGSTSQLIIFSKQPDGSDSATKLNNAAFATTVTSDIETAAASLKAGQVDVFFCDATTTYSDTVALLKTFDQLIFQPPLILTLSDHLAQLAAGCLRPAVWDVIPDCCTGQALVDVLGFAAVESRRRQRDLHYLKQFAQGYNTLSTDEAEVLTAVCEGKLNKQIARETRVSIRTVEQRRSRMFDKMGVSSAAPLAHRVATAQALLGQYPQFELAIGVPTTPSQSQSIPALSLSPGASAFSTPFTATPLS